MATKKKVANQVITVKVNEENPEPMEVIAKSIIEVSEAFTKLDKGPLKRHTIILLLQDATGLSRTSINLVIEASLKLRTRYLK